MKKIPPHIVEVFGSARKFRAFHRRGLQKSLRGLTDALRGCAYSPAYRLVQKARSALEAAIDATRVKNWEKKP